jgi:hypothetical protein
VGCGVLVTFGVRVLVTVLVFVMVRVLVIVLVNVIVRVSVIVGVSVGVSVTVGDGVKDAITKPVAVAGNVDDGISVAEGSAAWLLFPAGVQVAGMTRGMNVGVAVGMTTKMVGIDVGGGKGLNAELVLVKILPKTPHRQRVHRIMTMERISHMEGLTVIILSLKCSINGWSKTKEATSVSIYYFSRLSI